MKFIRTLRRDGARHITAAVLAVFFFWLSRVAPAMLGEPAFAAVFLSGALLVAAFSIQHVIRRLMWPYLDFFELIKASMGNPIGAGLAVIGLAMIISKALELGMPR